MNLEFTYGEQAKFREIVERAVKVNEPKEVYFAMIELYTRNEQYETIEGIFKILVKKYQGDIAIWRSYLTHAFEH